MSSGSPVASFTETPPPGYRLPRPAVASLWAASGRVQVSGALRRLLRRATIVLRGMGQPFLTRAWLARLVQPDIAPLWAERPRLALKLQRPYVSCAWDSRVRFAALVRHYQILCQLMAPEARMAIYRDGAALLRLRQGGGAGPWDLQLFYHDRFEKEGELTLAIRDVASGVMLAGLTFCLAHNAGRRVVIVGGVQAAADLRTLGLIHEATKAMHGIRPKALLLWCLQQLAEPWRLTQIQAVGDAQHVWRHWRKRLTISACYDEFWRESDGREHPGGGSWDLPLHSRVRTRADLKPSRRRTYERRYALLGALRPLLLAAFDRLAPGRGGVAEPAEFLFPLREEVASGPAALLLEPTAA